jgi:outer membrane protein TolC
LNVVVAAAQDVGNNKIKTGPSRLDRQTYDAGMVFEVPLQRRDALGQLRQQQELLGQLQARERFAQDQIRADVQDAWVRLEQAVEIRDQARERVRLTRIVADMERERFEGGIGNILFVTVREIDVFDAEVSEVAALLDYFQALADYRAALGLGGW